MLFKPFVSAGVFFCKSSQTHPAGVFFCKSSQTHPVDLSVVLKAERHEIPGLVATASASGPYMMEASIFEPFSAYHARFFSLIHRAELFL
jgi:hypothetical protein